MPRALAFKVQGAPQKTHWTLRQQDLKATDSIMQANGHYYSPSRDQPLPRYSDYDGSHYDGSHYSVASGMGSEGPWKPPEEVTDVGEFDAFDFHQTPANERHSLNLNTQVRQHNPDVVGRHLLYETALMDTQMFEILDIDEVDALKKEQVRLNSRIEAAQRKLVLESKVRDAAQNLQRLYSTNKRPDTPQSPDSPKKQRNSLLPGRPRHGSGGKEGDPHTYLQQADSELTSSVKKVDELNEQIKELLDRRQDVERKLLRHTAAVLAEEANKVTESAVPGMTNGHHFDDDVFGSYATNEFDGIRDILHGKPAGASGGNVQQYEDQFAKMQERLEQLNYSLRNVISEAGQTLGKPPGAEIGIDQSGDASVRLDNRFERLEHNLSMLEQQQHEWRYVEEQLEGVNGQLHNVILQASDDQAVPGLQEPPRADGYGYHDQLQYMEDGLITLEQLLQRSRHSGDSLEAKAKAEQLAKKNEDYEAVVGGLWEILQSDTTPSPRIGTDDNRASQPGTPLQESFSLQAFSARVQHVFDRAQQAKQQQDILRRQIQQQRELGGKSDMEKDMQIEEIQGRHDNLAQEHDTLTKEHDAVQQELANLMVKHEHSEGEASQSRTELVNVMNELEELRNTVETKQKERDDMASQTAALQQRIQELESHVSDLTDDAGNAESKHGEMHANMENLESEVVRLTTELTMAKAELDGAYGTRRERAGAQAAEVESLSQTNKSITEELQSLRAEVSTLRPAASKAEHASQLERELQEMTGEFQELTKESIALEKEREALDALIDSLRDRCDALETQLSDERVKYIGLKKEEAQEQRSILVLKQEFKKMMREQKAEGVKLLRAEQEERRKLEGELRKIRQANGPLAKSQSGPTTPQ